MNFKFNCDRGYIESYINLVVNTIVKTSKPRLERNYLEVHSVHVESKILYLKCSYCHLKCVLINRHAF